MKKNKIKHERKLFNLFTPNTPLSILQRPFNVGGYIAATNHTLLIYVRNDLVKGNYAPPPKPIKPPRESKTYIGEVTIDDMRRALSESPICEDCKIVKCKDCKGDGIVRVNYRSVYGDDYIINDVFCPVCDGVGRLRQSYNPPRYHHDPSHIVSIGDMNITVGNLAIIIKALEHLGVDSVRAFSDKKDVNVADVLEVAEGVKILKSQIVYEY